MLKKLEWETERAHVIAHVEKGQLGDRVAVRRSVPMVPGVWNTSYCSASMDLPTEAVWTCMSAMYRLLHGNRGTNSDVYQMVSLVERLS